VLASLGNKGEAVSKEGKVQLAEQEADLMLLFAEHIEREEERKREDTFQLERVKEENEWLREELEEAERKLEETLARLAGLEVEASHGQFLDEVKRSEEAADSWEVAPSKIPVGAFRVEEERAINRALSRPSSPRGLSRPSSPLQIRSPSPAPAPAPASRIPKISAPSARRPSRDTLRTNGKLSRASSTSRPHHPTPTR